MQYDPSKAGFNNQGGPYASQYPQAYPNQFAPGTMPPTGPPPYSQYGQPPAPPANYGQPGVAYNPQMPMYPPPGSVMMPMNRPPMLAMVPTSITGNLKVFFISSGILYLILGILSIGLEVGIVVNSYNTYYRGFWVGGYLVGSGISLLVAGGRGSFVLTRLTTLFMVALILSILGMITSIINYAVSPRCSSTYSWHYYSCDSERATQLKIAILAVMVLAIIHTIVNIVVASKAHKRAVLEASLHGPGQR